ncbi:MAG: amidohydrolase, partial [Ruminococcaceae bacterium]|nr:amidohydrolase [Oscillospiraceae bacterium]
ATNAHQLAKVNSFAIDINDFSQTLIALGSAHPDSEILEDELQRLIDHDIRGIKIHPEYMPYYIDDPEWDRVFSLCEEMGIFVLSHTGFDRVSPDKTASTPDRVAKVLDRHPNLTFIGAHMGGNRFYPQVLEYLCGRPNLYLDTAIMSRLDKNNLYVSRIIESHGVDRILFGTDAPWSEPKNEVLFIKSLGLGKENEEKIFHLNAEALLFR